MEDYIVVGIVALIVAAAVFRAVKHFKGGCCSGGSRTIRDKKALTAPKIGEKIMSIEGMHCENCEIRVENALNRLEGVVCKVNLKKRIAIISYSKEVSNEILTEIVEKIGYTVTEIK